MDNDLNEFINRVSDNYFYEMLLAIFKRLFPEDSIFLPIITLAKKYGMPARNIVPFIRELGEWCKEHQQQPETQQTLSDEDRQALSDLLSRSGFMTIGFDNNDRGDDNEN